MFKHITWDPDPVAFIIPLIHRPVAWYGVLFALGFFIGFYLLVSLFKRDAKLRALYPLEALSQKARLFSEKIMVYVVISTVIGARLGHILFYEKWDHYLSHPLDIVKTWEGGLASHGAIVGILIGLILFYTKNRNQFPHLSIRRVIDLMVVPALLVASFIRIGNFVNQEVLGTPTLVPWAIIFAHPIDGSASVPRHPAQLYEGLFYFVLFILFWKFFPRLSKPVGRLAGLFFLITFSFRFLIEFLKEEQSDLIASQWLTMGQWLSIPVILFGWALLKTAARKGKEEGAHLKV